MPSRYQAALYFQCLRNNAALSARREASADKIVARPYLASASRYPDHAHTHFQEINAAAHCVESTSDNRRQPQWRLLCMISNAIALYYLTHDVEKIVWSIGIIFIILQARIIG